MRPAARLTIWEITRGPKVYRWSVKLRSSRLLSDTLQDSPEECERSARRSIKRLGINISKVIQLTRPDVNILA